ncbi:unnamed protein product [Lepeophtheirus salmonis]|uniref:(salmon louse) hypothetical protein n=1 Tax=Lepeophtheirus salmonis TaxID=72036 RepID=A0A7R8CQI4_LEPSM|nr:unnamed protein product [Lepeophtheirus salmonis]CAF2893563.1 unnamed protein product [Lepeophtheirus salmonis]
MKPEESRDILLLVPPGNNVASDYRLRVEGSVIGGGAIAIYDGGHEIKIRAVMFSQPPLHPYNSIADLFIIDPDGFVIRKWNSKELNNGVLIGSFVLPMYPKVGFWKIQVSAQGQIEEKTIKIHLYKRIRDGIPQRNISLISQPSRYGYLDPYINQTKAPERPLFQNWTYIKTDARNFRQIYQIDEPFYLYMEEISRENGKYSWNSGVWWNQSSLPDIRVPNKLVEYGSYQDIDRLRHYGQPYGSDAFETVLDSDTFNPASLFTDDAEKNAKIVMDLYAKEKSYEEYRSTGVHQIKMDVPTDAVELQLEARYREIQIKLELTQQQLLMQPILR